MTNRPALLRQLAAAGLVLGLSACGGSDPQPVADGAAAPAGDAHGRSAYLANCSACHQRDGGGLKGAFPPLAGADWLRDHPTQRSIEVVLRGLSGPITVNGVQYNAVMPPAPHLSDRDVAAILTYVYGNWGNDGRMVTPEMVATVRAGGSLDDDAGAAPAAAPAGDDELAPAQPATDQPTPAAPDATEAGSN
jgi:mono/diheme cytochrome c family protein